MHLFEGGKTYRIVPRYFSDRNEPCRFDIVVKEPMKLESLGVESASFDSSQEDFN